MLMPTCPCSEFQVPPTSQARIRSFSACAAAAAAAASCAAFSRNAHADVP